MSEMAIPKMVRQDQTRIVKARLIRTGSRTAWVRAIELEIAAGHSFRAGMLTIWLVRMCRKYHGLEL